MDNENWMDEVLKMAQTDEWYQRWLADVQRLEPAYMEILHSLPKEQQETLDAYIAACEALESAQIAIAYKLGKSHRF